MQNRETNCSSGCSTKQAQAHRAAVAASFPRAIGRSAQKSPGTAPHEPAAKARMPPAPVCGARGRMLAGMPAILSGNMARRLCLANLR